MSCTIKKTWYINQDEGDARGARPASVRRGWFFYFQILKIKNRGITYIIPCQKSLSFVPNIINPLNSQSFKETSYSISSKSDLKVVLDARIYTK